MTGAIAYPVSRFRQGELIEIIKTGNKGLVYLFIAWVMTPTY
ncbi:hypothetical protein [Escherichia coli]|nr:hypothetical protein [Escherichia coli]